MKHRKPTPAWQKLGLKISKKVVVGITAAATAFGGLAIASTSAQASTGRDSYADTVQNATFEQARKKYGLAKEMSEGATLHAWEWSFKTIEENIPKIAEAGYTSIQTEPMSKIKVNDANGKKFTENWYYVYQPTNTSIGNFVVGSEDDLKAMTVAATRMASASSIDVVANHFTADLERHRLRLAEERIFPCAQLLQRLRRRQHRLFQPLAGDALPPAGPMGSEHRQSGSRPIVCTTS